MNYLELLRSNGKFLRKTRERYANLESATETTLLCALGPRGGSLFEGGSPTGWTTGQLTGQLSAESLGFFNPQQLQLIGDTPKEPLNYRM